MHERCKKDLHDYRLYADSDDVRCDQCILCGKKKHYNKDKKGKLDNREYSKDHRADVLQPFGKDHKEFQMVYGIIK